MSPLIALTTKLSLCLTVAGMMLSLACPPAACLMSDGQMVVCPPLPTHPGKPFGR